MMVRVPVFTSTSTGIPARNGKDFGYFDNAIRARYVFSCAEDIPRSELPEFEFPEAADDVSATVESGARYVIFPVITP